MALAAIELVDVEIEERYQYLPHIILKNLAQAVPGALQGLYTRLIERNLFWGDGILYREADAGTRDLLLAFLENEVQGNLEYQDLLSQLVNWVKLRPILRYHGGNRRETEESTGKPPVETASEVVHGMQHMEIHGKTVRLLFASRSIRSSMVVLLTICTEKEPDEHEASLLTRRA